MEEKFLRVGIQKEKTRSQRRNGPVGTLRRCAGKPAASGGLRHRPLRHSYRLDKYRPPKQYEIELDDLALPEKREILWAVFHDPERLRPKETRAGITKEAADQFSTLALRLQGRGTPEEVAHFVNQLVFCFFANSVRLLPEGFFPKLLKLAAENPDETIDDFNELFSAMEKGGRFGLEKIAFFNGGLFDGRPALRLESGDIGLLIAAGSLDWGQIDPTIFGTLFERFLDPDKRAQIGAHYTDPEKIMMIVEPVILRPLRAEWEIARAETEKLVEVAHVKKGRAFDNAMVKAEDPFYRRFRYVHQFNIVLVVDLVIFGFQWYAAGAEAVFLRNELFRYLRVLHALADFSRYEVADNSVRLPVGQDVAEIAHHHQGRCHRDVRLCRVSLRKYSIPGLA
jgi:hypothetical protein